MTQTTGTTPSSQDREGARAAMQDLPGETALGNVDPATAKSPDEIGRRAEDVAAEAGFIASEPRGGDSAAASSRAEADAASTAAPTGIADLPGNTSDTPLGDMSTGGEAAREALGVDPSDNRFGDVPDNSTGESTRAEVLGDSA